MRRPQLLQGWTDPASFRGEPPAVSPEQLALFPRTSALELSFDTSSKDLFQFVEADNGRKYYLKVDRGDKPLRANEYLGYSLAALVGVGTPRFDFIQTFDGDIAFGSESVAGVADKVETELYLHFSCCNEVGMPLNGLQARLSAIHALDLFIVNIDRHLNNFLVVGQEPDKQLLALDFARSGFWRWPWRGFLQPGDTSLMVWRGLRERHGFDLSAALMVVDRLGLIRHPQIEAMLNRMPTHWLSASLRSEFLAYCRDGGWTARVAALREGLENGAIV